MAETITGSCLCGARRYESAAATVDARASLPDLPEGDRRAALRPRAGAARRLIRDSEGPRERQAERGTLPAGLLPRPPDKSRHHAV